MRFLLLPLLIVLGLLGFVLPAPAVMKTTPRENVPLDQKIEITFSRPIQRRTLEKSISPDVPGVWVFEAPLWGNHLYRKAVFYPSRSFQPNTEYTVRLANITGAIRQTPRTEEEFAFQTTAAPGITQVFPPDGTDSLTPDTALTIRFSRPVDNLSEFHYRLEPAAPLRVEFSSDRREVRLVPVQSLRSETTYVLTVSRSDLEWDLDQDMIVGRSNEFPVWESRFHTNGHLAVEPPPLPPQVVTAAPADGWTGVDLGTDISLQFSDGTDVAAAADSLSFLPHTPGTISWNGSTLVFQPAQPLQPSTQYTMAVSDLGYEAVFTTRENVVRLAVPAYLQQHTLSCEVSALRMTLAYRGIETSEEALLGRVGFDTTPHKGNVWGNPNQAFVGNVDGRQMVDGYGVYWDPIARVGNEFREAEAFRQWDVSEVTKQIQRGHPVIVWVYSRNGRPTTWFTPEGEEILAAAGEHTVVVVGFVGPAEDPRELIVNDPLVGQVYWPRATFDQKWATFQNSGVVVY